MRKIGETTLYRYYIVRRIKERAPIKTKGEAGSTPEGRDQDLHLQEKNQRKKSVFSKKNRVQNGLEAGFLRATRHSTKTSMETERERNDKSLRTNRGATGERINSSRDLTSGLTQFDREEGDWADESELGGKGGIVRDREKLQFAKLKERDQCNHRSKKLMGERDATILPQTLKLQGEKRWINEKAISEGSLTSIEN